MNKNSIGLIVAVIVLALGGWYWYASVNKGNVEYQAPTGVTPSAPTQGMGQSGGQTSQVPVLKIGSNATLGNFLVAANGMTLYHFAKDAPGVSNCAGVCATNWPAYVVAAEPMAVGGGITGQLSTITKADGSKQLTYNGMPLYYWKNDVKVSDTTGEGFGGLWSVVKP